ncbi:MAG: S8 family serine peptidase [Acidobacteriota bacterium]
MTRVILGVALALCGRHSGAASVAADVRDRQIIVQTDDAGRIAALVTGEARPLFPLMARTPRIPSGFARERWFVVTLPEGTDREHTAGAIVSLGLARSAEPNVRTKIAATPSDPYFSSQGSWGQLYGDQWGLGTLELPQAWDTVKGDPNVIIAIVDTGIDFLHPDFGQALWVNPGEVPGNAIDDDGNGYADDVYGYDFASGQGGRDSDPTDGLGHGTMVAGVAGAATDNGIGLAGASWGCKLMICRALDDTGSGYVSDMGVAMQYAIDNGAKVINVSATGSGTSPYLESIVAAARQANVTVVVASGNYSTNTDYFTPANIDDVVTVGAMAFGKSIPSWSDFGATLDLVAPGVETLGPRALATDFLQSGTAILDTDYYHASGTSFSAPEVAAICGLLYSAAPALTHDQVVNVLRASASDVAAPGVDAYAGWGLPSARMALTLPRNATARIDTPAYRQVIAFAAPLTVMGTAAGAGMQSWQLFIGDDAYPATFTALTSVSTTPVTGGTLYSGPSTSIADGLHTLELRVLTTTGVTYRDRRLIIVDNSRGILSGSVQWQGGGPASNVSVWAMHPTNQTFLYQAQVDASGNFTFPQGIPAGFYVLFADATFSEYNSEFWKDKPSYQTALRVLVTPMATTSGFDFQLSRRPRVSGTVRDDVGVPVCCKAVELLYAATQTVAASTSTASDGSYLFTRLPTGDFYVRSRAYDGVNKTEYWQESPDIAGGTIITLVDDGTVSGIDFTLAYNSASISGKVTDAFGTPLPVFLIEVMANNGSLYRATITDAAGNYSMTQLPAGSYRVRTGQQYDYELQYFDHATTQQAAKTITLFEGGSYTGADLSLHTTWFQDVTASAGPLLTPESYGTLGVVPARLDGDARPDFYLVNQVGPCSYLLQDATGTFHDEAVTRGAGTADLKAQAVAFDMDNDGDQDLFVPKYGRFGAPSINVLLENDGPRFHDATYDAGVVSVLIGTDAAVGDYDNDGYLDLYLVNNFEVNALYHNQGDGTFADVTAASGAGGTAGNNTQNATFADVDGDGDLDILVTTSEFPTSSNGHLLFVNQGNGTFTEEGVARGLKLPSSGFASAFADVDDDGDLDLFMGSPYGGILYENDGAGRFTDQTTGWGLAGVTQTSGCSFGDMDNDGYLDLLVADFQGGARLLMGGPSTFTDKSYISGIIRSGQSYNLVPVDVDMDGMLDVVLSHNSTETKIYRNRLPKKRWLEVKLHGRRSNRDGIGAKVSFTALGRTQLRICGIGDAGDKVYPVVHFGLGATTAGDLTVRWPSGIVQTIPSVSSNQILDVTEPIGEAIAVAPGPGPANAAYVRLFDPKGARLALPTVLAYGAGYGANVAGGHLSVLAGPTEDFATMAGEGPVNGPHVRAFQYDATPIAKLNFYAYGTLRFGGDVTVARGLSPSTDNIVTGAGPGAVLAPHVRGFSDTGAALPGFSFFAYNGLTYGVHPGASDLDIDGRDDILTGPGPGPSYWANVKAFRYTGASIAPMKNGAFFAYTGPTAGARPAGGNGFIVASPGPSPSVPAEIRGFTYQPSGFALLPGYDAIVFPGHYFGAHPTMGDLDGTGFDEAIVAPGPSASYTSHVRGISYDGTAVQLMGKPNFFAFDPSYGYGANVGTVAFVP